MKIISFNLISIFNFSNNKFHLIIFNNNFKLKNVINKIELYY